MELRLARVVAIAGAGLVLGLVSNGLSSHGLALSRNVFLHEGDQEIEVAEAKGRLDHGALFLDARAIDFYHMAHVPGARSLPEEDFDRAFAGLEPLLRGRFDIVVYCSGFGCEASHLVARKLKARGIPAVVLHEGWPAWEEAGYPQKVGEAP